MHGEGMQENLGYATQYLLEVGLSGNVESIVPEGPTMAVAILEDDVDPAEVVGRLSSVLDTNGESGASALIEALLVAVGIRILRLMGF